MVIFAYCASLSSGNYLPKQLVGHNIIFSRPPDPWPNSLAESGSYTTSVYHSLLPTHSPLLSIPFQPQIIYCHSTIVDFKVCTNFDTCSECEHSSEDFPPNHPYVRTERHAIRTYSVQGNIKLCIQRKHNIIQSK